jgi:hypothetical protein
MEPLLAADQPDEGKILAQIDRVAQARAELEKANARMLLGLRRVLTSDQWKTLQADAPKAAPIPTSGRCQGPEATPDLTTRSWWVGFGGASPRRFRPRYAGANLGHPSHFLERGGSIQTNLRLPPAFVGGKERFSADKDKASIGWPAPLVLRLQSHSVRVRHDSIFRVFRKRGIKNFSPCFR